MSAQDKDDKFTIALRGMEMVELLHFIDTALRKYPEIIFLAILNQEGIVATELFQNQENFSIVFQNGLKFFSPIRQEHGIEATILTCEWYFAFRQLQTLDGEQFFLYAGFQVSCRLGLILILIREICEMLVRTGLAKELPNYRAEIKLAQPATSVIAVKIDARLNRLEKEIAELRSMLQGMQRKSSLLFNPLLEMPDGNQRS